MHNKSAINADLLLLLSLILTIYIDNKSDKSAREREREKGKKRKTIESNADLADLRIYSISPCGTWQNKSATSADLLRIYSEGVAR